jgi:hypothetical protein
MSPKMAVADHDTKTDAASMAQKQQHFADNFVVGLPTNSFTELDKQIPNPLHPTDRWTLHRYLMKAAPKELPPQCLFVNADQNWDYNGFQPLMTLSPMVLLPNFLP